MGGPRPKMSLKPYGGLSWNSEGLPDTVGRRGLNGTPWFGLPHRGLPNPPYLSDVPQDFFTHLPVCTSFVQMTLRKQEVCAVHQEHTGEEGYTPTAFIQHPAVVSAPLWAFIYINFFIIFRFGRCKTEHTSCRKIASFKPIQDLFRFLGFFWLLSLEPNDCWSLSNFLLSFEKNFFSDNIFPS